MRFLLQEWPLLFWMSVVMALWLGAYLLAAGVGLWTPQWWNDLRFVIVVALAGYWWALSGGVVGLSRFRHPMMPAICLLAAAGLERMSRRSRLA